MNCYSNNSSCTAMVPGCENWGLTVGCCERHRETLVKEINPGANIDAGFLEDYLKIYILFEKDKVTLTECMKKLGNELSVAKFGTDGARNNGYTKLSVVLSGYEKYCWFPPNHEIFIGFVPSGDFQGYIARGLMPKDPGAGVLHGDFTHRLQWHAISRIITQEFSTHKRAGWKKTPLELYTSLGKPPATTNNVWFKLIDQPSDNLRHPDNFHKFVKDGAKFGRLSEALLRRFENRMMEFDNNYDPAVAANIGHALIPAPTPEEPNKTRTVKRAYWDRAQRMANEAYTKKKLGGNGFDRAEGLPVLRRGGVEEDFITIDQRINASKTCLNKVEKGSLDYRAYSGHLGMFTRSSKGGAGLGNLPILVARSSK